MHTPLRSVIINIKWKQSAYKADLVFHSNIKLLECKYREIDDWIHLVFCRVLSWKMRGLGRWEFLMGVFRVMDFILEKKMEYKRWLMESKKCWSQWKGDLNRVEEVFQWALEQVHCRRRSWGRWGACGLAQACSSGGDKVQIMTLRWNEGRKGH